MDQHLDSSGTVVVVVVVVVVVAVVVLDHNDDAHVLYIIMLQFVTVFLLGTTCTEQYHLCYVVEGQS
jgi:hypothetical protein